MREDGFPPRAKPKPRGIYHPPKGINSVIPSWYPHCKVIFVLLSRTYLADHISSHILVAVGGGGGGGGGRPLSAVLDEMKVPNDW